MQVKTVKKISATPYRLATASRRAVLAALILVVLAALVPAQLVAQNAVPFVNLPLAPSAAAPAGAAFTLTVNGTGFATGAVVNWNGSPRTTTVVSSQQLTAAILATDIATAQTAVVTVTNPSGGTSAPTLFEVTKSGTGIFVARNDISTNTTAMAVAVGDFRGIGKQDMAIANSANSVDVLLGNGDGTFQTAVNYPLASGYPIGIIAADVNGDGKQDLVVLLNHTNMVQVLTGNGDGTFTAGQSFATGANPQWVAAADVNNDGKIDLLVADYKDNNVSVLLGNGDGTFQTKHDYATGVNPDGVAVGDFNGDGLLDLAVSNANDNTVSILLGAGNGTFPTHVDYPTAGLPTSVVVADFNRDGKLDLALSTAGAKISVLLGNGDGTFGAHVDYGVSLNPQMVVAADFNGDGTVDLANVNFSNNSVSLLQGVGDGTFKVQAVYPTNAAPGWIALGDFNSDGRIDMAVVDTTAGGVTVLTQSLLTISPTLLNYPKQLGGFPSAPSTLTIRNNNKVSVGISSAVFSGPNPGDFSVSATTCGTTISPGTTCTLSVVFTPQDLGNRYADLTVTESNGSTIGVALYGLGQILVAIQPDPHAFPTTLLGTSSKPFVANFRNYSKIPASVAILELDGLDTQDYSFNFDVANPCTAAPFVAPPLSTCYINVIFTPTKTGARTAGLVTFGHFSPGNGQQTILLSGLGTAVSVTPTKLTFGTITVGSKSQVKTVTIQNVNTTPLAVTLTFQTGNFNDFTQTNTCNGSIPAQSSCTVSVTFAPTATGARASALYIGDLDPTGPQIVTLTGTGQ